MSRLLTTVLSPFGKRGVTDGGRKEITFFWFVENYSYCWHENGEVLYCPQFTTDGLEGTAWTVVLCPKGWKGEDKGHISLFLIRSAEDGGPDSASVKWELSVLAADGSPLSSVESDDSFGRGDGRGSLKFLDMHEMFFRRKVDYVPQDILSVRCKIWIGQGNAHSVAPVCARTRIRVENISHQHVVENFSSIQYPSGVSEDMKAFYINKHLTYVELKTKTKSFPAHKIILCLRSPVFKRMLANEMKEKNSDCVHVVDLRDDVVQQLLIFLYSDTVENLEWEMATQLYHAASEYQIQMLEEVCSSFLVENLTPTTAGELLLLADTHSDPDLKKSVEDFILEHERAVFGSKEWEVMIETNPQLVEKAMRLKYKR